MNTTAHLIFSHGRVGALLEGLCCTVTVHVVQSTEAECEGCLYCNDKNTLQQWEKWR